MGMGAVVSAAFAKIEQDMDGTSWRRDQGLESGSSPDVLGAAVEAGTKAQNESSKGAGALERGLAEVASKAKSAAKTATLSK